MVLPLKAISLINNSSNNQFLIDKINNKVSPKPIYCHKKTIIYLLITILTYSLKITVILKLLGTKKYKLKITNVK